MFPRLLLAGMLALAPLAPALAHEDAEDLGVEAPPRLQMPSAEQLKGLKMAPSGGIGDVASAMKLIAIGQALKAKKPVSAADIQFLRTYLKQMGAGDPGNSSAAQLQKLDQVLDQLQRRQTNPTEMDEMMKELADGADMNDLPKFDE